MDGKSTMVPMPLATRAHVMPGFRNAAFATLLAWPPQVGPRALHGGMVGHYIFFAMHGINLFLH